MFNQRTTSRNDRRSWLQIYVAWVLFTHTLFFLLLFFSLVLSCCGLTCLCTFRYCYSCYLCSSSSSSTSSFSYSSSSSSSSSSSAMLLLVVWAELAQSHLHTNLLCLGHRGDVLTVQQNDPNGNKSQVH